MWRFNNQEKEKKNFFFAFCRFVSQVLHDVSHVLHLRHLFQLPDQQEILYGLIATVLL
jgi:hypothetical protein